MWTPKSAFHIIAMHHEKLSFVTSSNLLKRLKKTINPQTIRTGSSLHLAAQAFICLSLPDPVRKECKCVGTWSAEILEDDDGPHPAPRTWKGESEVSWWWEASPVW